MIRARTSIGTLDIAAMTHKFAGQGAKVHRPRIESPIISSLTVDNMECGVIWSGRLDYATETACPGVPQVSGTPDPYAAIASARIGCVSPTADVWFKQCSLFEVTGNVYGELHAPTIAANETLRINGRLGALDAALSPSTACGCLSGAIFGEFLSLGGREVECPTTCDGAGSIVPVTPTIDTECGYLPVRYCDGSPRGVRAHAGEAADGVALHGALRIANTQGLAGQVVINGAASTIGSPPAPATPAQALPFWGGEVRVITPKNTAALSADEDVTISNPDLSPAYRYSSMEFGNGAVGLVPYQYYASDSIPPAPSGQFGLVTISSFVTNEAIRARLYGPFKVGSGVTPTQAVTITRVSTGLNVNSDFTISFHSINGSQREIRVSPKSGVTYPAAQFTLRPVLTGANRLLCDRLATGTADTTVSDFTFGFQLTDDSFGPGCDFNGDGSLDPDDLADFVACYFASPSCPETDINQDGNIDPDDLSDYIAAYFSRCL